MNICRSEIWGLGWAKAHEEERKEKVYLEKMKELSDMRSNQLEEKWKKENTKLLRKVKRGNKSIPSSSSSSNSHKEEE